MSTPLERAAEAVRNTRAFQASAVFGIPADAHQEASSNFARAALEAAIDEGEIVALVEQAVFATGTGLEAAIEAAAAIKAHLLGGAE